MNRFLLALALALMSADATASPLPVPASDCSIDVTAADQAMEVRGVVEDLRDGCDGVMHSDEFAELDVVSGASTSCRAAPAERDDYDVAKPVNAYLSEPAEVNDQDAPPLVAIRQEALPPAYLPATAPRLAKPGPLAELRRALE